MVDDDGDTPLHNCVMGRRSEDGTEQVLLLFMFILMYQVSCDTYDNVASYIIIDE